MLDYADFKIFFFKLFGVKNIDVESEEYTITINRGFRTTENQSFTIPNSELFELFSSVCEHKLEGLSYIQDNCLETVMDTPYPRFRIYEIDKTYTDSVNEIEYRLGLPTKEYAMLLLIKLYEEYYTVDKPRIPMPIRFARINMETLFQKLSSDSINWYEVLPYLVGEISLKITTKEHYDLNKLKCSFIFNYMYNKNIALVEYNNLTELFKIREYRKPNKQSNDLDSPPMRVYSEDVVDYYKLALSSDDAYIQFISFYHVIEYFYDEVFKRKLIKDLQEKITHPGFSYNNGDQVYSIAAFVKNRMRMNDEKGQGNEEQSLNFVLNEYINIDDLIERLDEIDPNCRKYYETNKVSFSGAPTLPFGDRQGIINKISKRIYKTRNSLVHSKSGKNHERYKPYQDEDVLSKEIPLLKGVAEQIIINSSNILKP